MQSFVEPFLKPRRISYSLHSLGPRRFILAGKVYRRVDFDLQNDRSLSLKCSFFECDQTSPSRCVVYCHGNCGNRMDSLEIIDFVLPEGMTLCAFDFSGSGQSEGEYVSFGYYEQRDVDCVVQYLLGHHQVTDIVLWGRSMGAVAALLYASNHHFVRCVVADSPFVNFKDLCLKVIESYHIPRFLSGYIVDRLRAAVLEKAGFLIEDVDTLRAVSQCSMPLIFIHSAQDRLVDIDQSRRLFEVCRSESTFLEVQGSHNAMRAEQVVKKAVEEVLHHLAAKQVIEEETAPTVVRLPLRVKEFIQRERPAHSRNETRSWGNTYPEQLFKQALHELQRSPIS